MSKREAKRFAAGCIATSIETQIMGGTHWLHEGLSAADSDRVVEATWEIIEELRDRAAGSRGAGASWHLATEWQMGEAMRKIHARQIIHEEDGSISRRISPMITACGRERRGVFCGLAGRTIRVGPTITSHDESVTCKRCLRSLHRAGLLPGGEDGGAT